MTAQLSGFGEDLTGKVCTRLVWQNECMVLHACRATSLVSQPYFTPCACALEKGRTGKAGLACETTTAIYTLLHQAEMMQNFSA